MLTFAHPPLVWIVGAALGALVAAWTYARGPATATRPRRLVLAVLRGLALGGIAFALAGPLATRRTPEERPASVAVLADDSRSVGVLDSLAGRTFARRLDTFATRLAAPVRLDRYRFDRTLAPSTGFADLRFRGTRTDLAGALVRASERGAGRNLQGIVVFTDGRPTAGRDPLAVAATLGVPVFPVMLGDTARAARQTLRDVAVDGLLANARVPGGATQPVEVRVTAQGYAGVAAAVTLRVNGAVAATGTVVLPPDGGIASVRLDYSPPASGVVALSASVTPLAGEATTANNTLSRTVEVLSDRLKVLVIAAAPDPDVAVVRTALDTDAGMDLTVRVQKAPGVYYEGGAVDAATFDVAVLVGFPGAASDPAVVQQMVESPRLGLVFVPTTRTDAGRLAPLAPLLAAAPGPLGAAQAVALTPAGSAHPALEGVPMLDALGSLPARPLAPAAFAPGARILWQAASGAPALAVERRGRRGSAVLLVGGLWQWTSLPPELAGRDTLVKALLPRLVRFATPNDTGTGLTAASSSEEYGPGETVGFSATAVDERGQPVDGAGVEIELTGPGGTRRLPMQAMGQGRFGLSVPDLPPGAYRWRAVGRGVAGAASGAFRVEGSAEAVVGEELRQIGPDPSLLRALASATGGEVYTLATLGQLTARLDASPQFRPALVPREAATPVWDRWPWLALLLALLAAEWMLRKRWGYL